MPPEPDDIEEYWGVARPERLVTPQSVPSESMTVEEVLKTIKKFNKEVLCMGLAVMVNHGDVSSPTIVAESAKELERLTKNTLVQLTLLAGVPVSILKQCNDSRTNVRSRNLDDPRASNNLFMPDRTEEPQSMRILPQGQVRSAMGRILQPQSRCSNCGVLTNSNQRLCDPCRVHRAQARRRRSGY
jgi:hypothetical protein